MGLREKLKAKAMESVANCGGYNLSPDEAAEVVIDWLESEAQRKRMAAEFMSDGRPFSYGQRDFSEVAFLRTLAQSLKGKDQ